MESIPVLGAKLRLSVQKNGEEQDHRRPEIKLLERWCKDEDVTGTKLKLLQKIKRNGTNLCTT